MWHSLCKIEGEIKMTYIEYEVYARYGETDVVICETLEEAIAVAIKWSMGSIDTDISIEKVTVTRETHIKCFRNGGEVA
jgi:hypothetical protein